MEMNEFGLKVAYEIDKEEFDDQHNAKISAFEEILRQKSVDQLEEEIDELEIALDSMFEHLMTTTDLGLAEDRVLFEDGDLNAHVRTIAVPRDDPNEVTDMLEQCCFHIANYFRRSDGPGGSQVDDTIAYELSMSVNENFYPAQDLYRTKDMNVQRQGCLALYFVPELKNSHATGGIIDHAMQLAEAHQTIRSFCEVLSIDLPDDYREPSLWPPDSSSIRE